ncbi:MAG: spore coat protein CotJB [Halanaerobiales bacterium]
MPTKQKELLKEIMEYQFAVLETVLYLDTHPEDRTVLELHNEYSQCLHNLMHKYQENYTLLVNDYHDSDYPWEWIEEPWPWQINYN